MLGTAGRRASEQGIVGDSRRGVESRSGAPEWNPTLPLPSSVKSAKGLVSKGMGSKPGTVPNPWGWKPETIGTTGLWVLPRTVTDLGPPSPTPVDSLGGRKVQSQSMSVPQTPAIPEDALRRPGQLAQPSPLL